MSSKGLFAVDAGLDGDAEFLSALYLSEAGEGGDVLAAESRQDAKQRWLKIAAITETLAARHADCRLELIRYRCDLNLRGFSDAIRRLHGWFEAEKLDASSTLDLPEADLPLVFSSLSYFMGDMHLREVRGARIHQALSHDVGLLSQLHSSAATEASTEFRDARREIALWTLDQYDLVSDLRGAKNFLRMVEKWLSANRVIDSNISGERIMAMLTRVEEAFSKMRPASSAKTAPDAGQPVGHSPAPSADAGRHTGPDVRNIAFGRLQRDDIVVLLNGVCEWYEINEPSSPVPHLIRRAKRMVNSDFLAIVQDLLPDSVAHFEKLAGLGPKK